MKLWFSMGTAGELIKIFPLIKLAEENQLNWMAIHTGQSCVNYWKQWEDFQLPVSKSVSIIETGKDLTSASSALKWFLQSLILAPSPLRERLGIRESEKCSEDFFFVHGDTLSTLLGATYAKRLGMKLVHVEAGLRSKYLFQPFPEEINRRLTSELVDWHMAPDETAKHNLLSAGFEEQIVDTSGNTLIDSIRRVLGAPSPLDWEVPGESYVVANLHRHENLTSTKRWNRLVETVLIAQQKLPVYFALHAPAEEKLNEDSVSKQKLIEAGVTLLPRMKFSQFIRLLNSAEYVLSDGGSNQEECYYLGKPCLILRETTERIEGLGENALLSQFHTRKIKHFIENYKSFKRDPIQLSIQPSRKILSTLGILPPSK